MDAVVSSQTPTLWESVRQALRGSHQDFTAGSLNRAIFLLAIPMVLEMFMESLFSVVDVLWVARLGADSVATVGLTESMLTLVYAVAIGLALSTAAMVARCVGEKDGEGAAVAAVQAVAIGLVVSLAMGLPGLLYGARLLRAMGATPGIIVVGSTYTCLMLAASGIPLMLFLNNAIFRGAGDAAVAMRVLWLANGINWRSIRASSSAGDLSRASASPARRSPQPSAAHSACSSSSTCSGAAPSASA